MMKHRRILAWQLARQLIREVYRVTKAFPAHERYALTIQLRRAAVSVAANIAEGQARLGSAEASHGASMSLGSLGEVDTLMAVAEDQEYVNAGDLQLVNAAIIRACKVTVALQRSLRDAVEAEKPTRQKRRERNDAKQAT